MSDTEEYTGSTETAHTLSVAIGEHAPKQSVMSAWQIPDTMVIENFNHLEEWRRGTQELRVALHNFLLANPDINKMELTIEEFR